MSTLNDEVKKMLEEQNCLLWQHMQKIRAENLKLHQCVGANKFSYHVMERGSNLAEYLTGCTSYDVFKWLLRFVAPHVESQSPNSLADQLMLTLMRIKLDLPDVFLSKLFRNADVDRIVQAWLNGLHAVCLKLLVWPENESNNPDTYIINTVKLNMNFKVVIIFTASGAICCISNVVTDNTALESCNILDKMNAGDVVLDITNAKCFVLKVHKDTQRKRLSSGTKQDVLAIQKARKTVNVAMEKLNNFAVLSKDVKDAQYTSKVVKISGALINFYPNQ